jgi:hypothetical protein
MQMNCFRKWNQKKRGQWTENNLPEAVPAVEEGMSIK